MPPEGLVFDMDGLILDTERIARDGFVEACRRVGVTPDMDCYLRAIGTSSEVARRVLVDGHGESFPVDDVLAAWNEWFRKHRDHETPPVKAGAGAILKAAARLGIPCALATSSWEPGVGNRLARVGLVHYFRARVTGDQVGAGKPDPETFLKAAARLKLPPRRCWAFEDSANGVRAAVAAGMEVFQIPDLAPPDEALLELGHTVLPDLDSARAHLESVVGNSPART